MRGAVYFLPALLFGLLVAAFVAGLDRDPSKLPSMLIDKPLPPFALGPVRPGEEGLKSTDLRGGPRLLNVFASWCVSCRVEHPLLLALKAQGVPIEGLDWKDEAADGAKYLADNGDPYGLVGSDRSGRAGIDLGVAGVPETFVVDGRGVVRYKQVGPIAPEDWENTIRPLMARLAARS
jgi:cytochrome c biogenesis protein CcmG, thiol:disulfide interchange protein DsbE